MIRWLNHIITRLKCQRVDLNFERLPSVYPQLINQLKPVPIKSDLNDHPILTIIDYCFLQLIKQLKPGGRLLVPIKSDPNDDPILTIIDRYMNNTVVTTEVQRIFIEPLRELYEQRSLNRYLI